MKPSPDDLEKFAHRVLRDLPARRAPRTLEGRVLAEIGRRAALPWWRQSFLHWPAAVRGIFFVVSAAAAAAAIAGLFGLARGPESAQWAQALSQRFGWLLFLRTLCADSWQAAGDVYRAIPPLWLTGALAVVVACYATLLGVGAAAYRTFFHRT
jgi:hypothetical protein